MDYVKLTVQSWSVNTMAEHSALATKPCKCGGKMEEVINYVDTEVRVGWYCPKCKTFDTAIGRERKLA